MDTSIVHGAAPGVLPARRLDAAGHAQVDLAAP